MLENSRVPLNDQLILQCGYLFSSFYVFRNMIWRQWSLKGYVI